LKSAQEARRRERDRPLTFSLATFEHACAYRDVYRAMAGGQGSIIAAMASSASNTQSGSKVSPLRRATADVEGW
jgi:hypothetical protein